MGWLPSTSGVECGELVLFDEFSLPILHQATQWERLRIALSGSSKLRHERPWERGCGSSVLRFPFERARSKCFTSFGISTGSPCLITLLFFGVALMSVSSDCSLMPFGSKVCKPESSRSGWTSSSSGSTQLSSESQLPVRPRIFQGCEDRSMKIKTRSRSTTCHFCKEKGHHIGNCVKALEDRVKHVAVDCARGVHYPFLHGVWRCEWCWEHLDERDVKRLNPKMWQRETAREAEKWDRYMDPTLHEWQ